MSELQSLHLLDMSLTERYLAAIVGRVEPAAVVPAAPEWSAAVVLRARVGYERALAGQELGANMMTLGLAQILATAHPTYLLPNGGLTAWEARIDRGVGMMMRPPSRLFGPAGLPAAVAHRLPIRIDHESGMMGGAYVPAHLIPELQRRLEAKAAVVARRLHEAEYPEPVALVGAMIDAAAAAAAAGTGLFEAVDVVVPGGGPGSPPGAVVISPDRRRMPAALRTELEEAIKPPKKPGLLSRLLRRDASPT